ncbi:MAG: hypothetical protein CVU59_00055 [Deltaproteobacteria bacterium HGW-Deltaproteobacteria-17]|nr:MAG: hypothetical protein CVU59_00055 [Deltaproteobacteria bacterium HGW-Deltaproteobacteria-17]
MKQSFLVFFLFVFSCSACETDLKEGHYTCDPNEPGACPDGWVCQLRGTDGIYRCYETAGAYCQNGVLDPGEICDGTDLGDFTCEAGWPICLTNCTAICTECGNGHIELNEFGVGEECDDGNSDDGDGCSSECLIERSYCVERDSDECLNWCGDGIINGPELCEPGNLGGYDCTDFGFHDGTLGCTADCRAFDDSACAHYCGDGQIHEVESCDSSNTNHQQCTDFYFSGGTLGCESNCSFSFSNCFNSWKRQIISTFGTISAIHGTGPENVFAVSLNGWIGQWDGISWTEFSIAGSPMLNGVFTNGPNDAWAIASNGTVLQFDGTQWNDSIFPPSTLILGIWGSASDDMYIVGQVEEIVVEGGIEVPYRVGALFHYNGAIWQELFRLPVSELETSLKSISGSGPEDIWVSGDNASLFHYDGMGWTPVNPPVEWTGIIDLKVHVVDSTRMILLAIDSNYSTYGAIHEFDFFRLLNFEPSTRVTGISGGTLFDLVMTVGNAQVLRLDGDAWRTLTPVPQSQFYSIWSYDGVFWVGGSNGLLLRYDGDFEYSSKVFSESMTRIWGPNNDELYVLSLFGKVYHLENGSWTQETVPVGLSPKDLWGPDENFIIAVGSQGKTAVRRDGAWSALPSIPSSVQTLFAVHGCDHQNIWSVGLSGHIRKFENDNWIVQTLSEVSSTLNDVFCNSPTDVWAVGMNGTILHYDGSVWTSVDSGTSETLQSVWANSEDNVYAVGNNGIILHFDGDSWSRMESLVGITLRDIQGTNARDIWTVGSSANLLHYDGIRFSPMTIHGYPVTNRIHIRPNGNRVITADTKYMEYHSAGFINDTCFSTIPLYCDENRFFDTEGLPARFDQYQNNIGFSGAEASFNFTAPFSGRFSWTLSHTSANTRIIAISEDKANDCDTSQIIGISTIGLNPDTQTLELLLERNSKIIIVLDSSNATTGYIHSVCERMGYVN